MKKLSLAALLTASVIAVSSVADAQNNNSANNMNPSTVSQAQNMADDTFVVLQGMITSKTGDEMYIFTDNTGTIAVEIDDDDMAGLNLTPQDVVIIQGEIDKNGNVVEVDVDEIVMANQPQQ